MVNSLANEGKIICFEPHWISAMSSYELQGFKQSQIVPLGILQKLFENNTGKDGNIGARVPAYLAELGVKNIECRVSDKVNFLHVDQDQLEKQKLFDSLQEEGIGGEPTKKEEFIEGLIKRGLTMKESQAQFEAELLFSQVFNMDSSLIYAPSMKITYGDIGVFTTSELT